MAKRRKTGGRRPGSLNRNTLVGKGASEIFKHMMGIDDAAVERTGRIDGKGYGFRLRWRRSSTAGGRPISRTPTS